MLDRYDQDLLLDYLEGELAPEQQAELDQALEQDPQLASLLSAMASDRELLRAVPREQAPGDLTHDLTQSLERQMLLDDSVNDTGPIPLARGRGLAAEPVGRIGWGRVMGLTGLAASVALVAGLVVITMNTDDLKRTADTLAGSTENDKPSGQSTAGDPSLAKQNDDARAKAESLALKGDEAMKSEIAGLKPTGVDTNAGQPGALARVARDDSAFSKLFPIPSAPGQIKPETANAATPAIALAATPPVQQLVLHSERPEITREQLFMLCVDNGIPIVQTNYRTPQAEPGFLGDPDAQKPPQGDPSDDQQPDAGYALLINQAQLAQLVTQLNDASNLAFLNDRNDALVPNAPVNQAAMLDDLQGAGSNPGPANERRVIQPKTNEAELGDAPRVESVPKAVSLSDQPTPHTTIELRLPSDLGSAYANTRNTENLLLEQQRSAYGANDTATDPIIQPQPEKTKVVAAPKQAVPGAGADAPGSQDKVNLAEAKEEASPPHDRIKKDDSKSDGEVDGALIEDQPRARSSPDANHSGRGNWLAPHLPLAGTTTILGLRQASDASTQLLVPIRFNQAPAELIVILRARQLEAVSSQDERADALKPAETGDLDKATKSPAEAAEPDVKAEPPTEPEAEATE